MIAAGANAVGAPSSPPSQAAPDGVVARGERDPASCQNLRHTVSVVCRKMIRSEPAFLLAPSRPLDTHTLWGPKGGRRPDATVWPGLGAASNSSAGPTCHQLAQGSASLSYPHFAITFAITFIPCTATERAITSCASVAPHVTFSCSSAHDVRYLWLKCRGQWAELRLALPLVSACKPLATHGFKGRNTTMSRHCRNADTYLPDATLKIR